MYYCLYLYSKFEPPPALERSLNPSLLGQLSLLLLLSISGLVLTANRRLASRENRARLGNGSSSHIELRV